MKCESMTGDMLLLAAAVTPALVHAAPTPEELAKMAQNPVANLITVPFQNNTSFNVGPQSGAQNVELHVDSSFVPDATGSLINANGNPMTGINFGTERIPVKAYFDAAQQAIVALAQSLGGNGRTPGAKASDPHKRSVFGGLFGKR